MRWRLHNNVLGGHLIALLIGSGATALGEDPAIVLASEGTGAVGLSILVMSVTDTERTPATSTGLEVVSHSSSWNLALFLTLSIAVMIVAYRLLPRWLLDLD